MYRNPQRRVKQGFVKQRDFRRHRRRTHHPIAGPAGLRGSGGKALPPGEGAGNPRGASACLATIDHATDRSETDRNLIALVQVCRGIPAWGGHLGGWSSEQPLLALAGGGVGALGQGCRDPSAAAPVLSSRATSLRRTMPAPWSRTSRCDRVGIPRRHTPGRPCARALRAVGGDDQHLRPSASARHLLRRHGWPGRSRGRRGPPQGTRSLLRRVRQSLTQERSTSAPRNPAVSRADRSRPSSRAEHEFSRAVPANFLEHSPAKAPPGLPFASV